MIYTSSDLSNRVSSRAVAYVDRVSEAQRNHEQRCGEQSNPEACQEKK